jgi:hypothetical protein
MDFSLVSEMFWHAAFVLFGIPFFFFLFSGLFVWESRFSPRRFGDIHWKRVDYVWIIAGSTGLVFQFIQIGLDSKLSNLKLEEGFGALSSQSLNIAAEALSDDSICVPTSVTGKDDTSKNSAIELADACLLFQTIRPVAPRSTAVDMKIFINFDSVFPTAEKITNPLVVERVKRFKQEYADYEQQANSINNMKYSVRTYQQYLKFFQAITTVLLVLAVALRLAKVKGEIRLKTHPIEKKSDISVSPEMLKNAVHGMATSVQLYELTDRLKSLEKSNRLKLNIIFFMMFLLGAGLISLLVSFDFHQFW